MPTSISPQPGESVVLGTEPQLFASDRDASLRFYRDRIGFEVAFFHGGPAYCAQIVRDNGRLTLRHIDGPVFDATRQAREWDVLSATLVVDDAKPMFLEFQQAGVPFHQALRTEPWGALTVIVEDPDGNLIAFAGRDAQA